MTIYLTVSGSKTYSLQLTVQPCLSPPSLSAPLSPPPPPPSLSPSSSLRQSLHPAILYILYTIYLTVSGLGGNSDI